MSTSKSKATQWKAIARMLALVAAVTLALDLHPAHAGTAGHADGHGHFGSFCDPSDLGDTPTADRDSPAGSSGDCTHYYDPMLRPPAEQFPAYVDIVVTPSYAEPHRQIFAGFDPPPPRLQS